MKRCPECEFLYEDESLTCDMDGTPLRYTVRLPTLPGLAKSIWDKWTITLLCAVIFGTLFVILYRATPRAYTSSTPAQVNSPAPETSPANQNAQPSDTPVATESPESEEAVDPSDVTRDPFDPQSTTKTRTPRRTGSQVDEKESTSAPVIHFEPAASLPALGTSSTAAKRATEAASEKSAAQTSGPKASSAAASAGVHPKPPDNYANKPAQQNQQKDSGVKSFFKKAGKVLKKPFGEN